MLTAAPAMAATYTVTATSAQWGMEDWSMTVDDANNDNIFTASEVISVTPFTIWGGTGVSGIAAMPDVTIDTTFSLAGANTWFDYNWRFVRSTGGIAYVGQNAWTYSVSQISAVPIPAAGFLLIGGLGAMGALRMRRKAS